MTYAEGTMVPVERSRSEVERLLSRYGATRFVSGWDETRAMIGFQAHGRSVRFVLSLPSPKDAQFHEFKRKNSMFIRRRTPEDAKRHYDAEVRRRWRAFALVIKAKLEAVESGISHFEEEFMPWIVMPDGKTVGEHVQPQIHKAYETNEMPQLLLGPASK